MIRLANVSKVYRDADRQIDVFSELNCTIARGQTVALMGQSGCGKSTLLHLIGGFDKVSSGQIWVGDSEVTGMSDKSLSRFRRQNLGMIFQQYNLIPCLSALDNITFVRRLNGLPALDSYTEQLIAVLGLESRLQHFPAQLSGGEQQRVAIARALAAKPEVILADEPTGNLDEQTAAKVMSLLVKAVSLEQVTLLLVTHSQTTAAYLQQQWLLEKGRLEQGLLKCSAE